MAKRTSKGDQAITVQPVTDAAIATFEPIPGGFVTRLAAWPKPIVSDPGTPEPSGATPMNDVNLPG